MISETITFHFDNEVQQQRFREVLNGAECVAIDATTAEKIKKIFGLLWNTKTDCSTYSGVAVIHARKIASSMINKADQAEGIDWARDEIPRAFEAVKEGGRQWLK